MSQESASQPKRRMRAKAWWATMLTWLFVILNIALSGPPGWQRSSQKPARQHEQDGQIDYLVGALLSLILIALNTVFLLQLIGLLATEAGPDLGLLSQETPIQAFIIYLVISFLFSFFLCLLRGRHTRKMRSPIAISIWASLISGISLFFLPIILALIIGGAIGSNFFIFLANGSPAFIAFWQVLTNIVGGILGGLIGSRLLRKRHA